MINEKDALRFLATLSSDDWRKFTQTDFDRIAEFTNSDGCTGVIDFYRNGCILHDFGYRTHLDFKGNKTAKEATDIMLRDYIRSKSWFGKYSPLAWWRWQGVKYLAERAWRTNGND